MPRVEMSVEIHDFFTFTSTFQVCPQQSDCYQITCGKQDYVTKETGRKKGSEIKE